jgi:hypothetical protein
MKTNKDYATKTTICLEQDSNEAEEEKQTKKERKNVLACMRSMTLEACRFTIST